VTGKHWQLPQDPFPQPPGAGGAEAVLTADPHPLREPVEPARRIGVEPQPPAIAETSHRTAQPLRQGTRLFLGYVVVPDQPRLAHEDADVGPLLTGQCGGLER
jgi:hypothetical protein